MKSDASFNEAKQLYLEQYASAIVTGGYLKIAVAVLSLVILGLVLMNLKVVRTLENFKPLVIRIDELGRAQAVAYESLSYKPEYKETKYFLTRFCQLYYRRNRSTINDDFSQAMYFLDGKLASDTIQEFKQKGAIKAFLTDNLAPERDIDVQQVVIEPMDKTPYKATVDFFEIEYSPADHSITKRRLYTASFLFNFRARVPNEEILTNPLGLAITYFRDDEAFSK
ncbi:MAG: VirB8/TrbF family protein [Candidatus Acidiferrum sp.]